MRPSAVPAIAPAMTARRGVITGPTTMASSPAIGKLRNAKTQNNQKRRFVESSFIIDTFSLVYQIGIDKYLIKVHRAQQLSSRVSCFGYLLSPVLNSGLSK